MNLRERVRKYGGEEMVAEYDFGEKIERELSAKLKEIITATMREHIKEGVSELREGTVASAICEALSQHMAAATIAYAGMKMFDDGDEGRLKTVSMAMQSLATNMNNMWETRDAEKNGVGEKIMAAFKAFDKGDAK